MGPHFKSSILSILAFSFILPVLLFIGGIINFNLLVILEFCVIVFWILPFLLAKLKIIRFLGPPATITKEKLVLKAYFGPFKEIVKDSKLVSKIRKPEEIKEIEIPWSKIKKIHLVLFSFPWDYFISPWHIVNIETNDGEFYAFAWDVVLGSLDFEDELRKIKKELKREYTTLD